MLHQENKQVRNVIVDQETKIEIVEIEMKRRNIVIQSVKDLDIGDEKKQKYRIDESIMSCNRN